MGVIVAILILWYVKRRETMVSRQEKVDSIYNWWKKTPNPKYNIYKNKVKHSDVVEYRKIKQLVTGGGDLSKQQIEKIIT